MLFYRIGCEVVVKWTNEQQRQQYFAACPSVSALNARHDALMQTLIAETLTQLGQAPCRFTVFITGSGGRKEQGFWSDQDHGLIYTNEAYTDYFVAFGQALSHRLAAAGYAYCDGGIMTSNPQWNGSVDMWQRQLNQWLQAAWSEIRYTQIFYDARSLFGDDLLLLELKRQIDNYISQHPQLLKRFSMNITHFKRALGPFSQLLPERYGEYQRKLDLKYSAFLPYSNCVRLLALEHHVHATFTQERIAILAPQQQILLEDVGYYFEALLSLRFHYQQPKKYQDTYYISLNELSTADRRLLKKILQRAKQFHEAVIARYT